MVDAITARRHTSNWLEQFVVGLNLCPFARPVLGSEQLQITVCEDKSPRQLQRAFLLQLDELQSTAEQDLATALLVFTGALEDFSDYLDFLDDCQQLLEGAGLEGLVQLASFHPDYQFEGEDARGASRYSNRSPYPVIHLIREDMLARVLRDFPQPEQIPLTNIATLDNLGVEELEIRWQALLD